MEKVLRVFCDGGARGNPGPAAVGFVVKDNKGRTLVKIGKYIGKTTNNVAEYQAVLSALKWLKKNYKGWRINFFLDSQLVVNQLTGRWRIRERRLKKLAILIKNLERSFSRIAYSYWTRELVQEADRLVKTTLASEGKVR